MTTDPAPILALADAGRHPEAIARALPHVKIGVIYATLRKHRPDRQRKPRKRTSVIPMQVRALAALGADVDRIALLLGITKAYVYRSLTDDASPVP